MSSPGPRRYRSYCSFNLAKCGFPINQDTLYHIVQKNVNEGGRETLFNKGRPCKTWLKLFLRRHPEIVERVPETIGKGRAVVTEESIRSWFTQLEAYVKEINAENVFKDPRRILNADETGFSLCPKTGRVLALKGYKNVYEIKAANEKDNITVLFSEWRGYYSLSNLSIRSPAKSPSSKYSLYLIF